MKIINLKEAEDAYKKATDFVHTIYNRGHRNPIGPGVVFNIAKGEENNALIKVLLIPNSDGHVHISELAVLDKPGGLGFGSFVLKLICSEADKYNIKLTLFAVPLDIRDQKKIPKNKLKQFYKKYGFKQGGGDYMEREPQ